MSNEPFVPIEELAKHFTVSVSTIRSWIRGGHIPTDTYFKVGNTYRFSVSAVSNALTSADPKQNEIENPIDEIDWKVGGTAPDETPQLELNLDDDL